MPGKSILKTLIAISLVATLFTLNLSAQRKIGFGIHADPLVSWFGTDISSVRSDGARSGFGFGLSFNSYFSPNYSISTGIKLINAGGRLYSTDTLTLRLSKNNLLNVDVLPNETVTYKIQYLSVPIGLKLQTNQIGYLTFFTDAGLDPRVVVGAKADIPSKSITGENAINEVRKFNMAYHITAGIEYGLGGNTAFVAGIGFENNFLDITKDFDDQPADKTSQKIINFRIGINF